MVNLGKCGKKILVVDDERVIREMLVYNLKKEGYKVIEAEDGVEAIELAVTERPDLILLDVMIPKLDGLSVCKRIKDRYNVPIIMVSAKDAEIEKILGLEIGADDYITKPFSIRELIARVKANLRRTSDIENAGGNASANTEKRVYIDEIELDVERLAVTVSGETIELSLREFEVMKYLALNRGQLVTREILLEAVWGYEHFGDKRTVDVTVRRIREKIEKVNRKMQCIKTKRGVGYYIL